VAGVGQQRQRIDDPTADRLDTHIGRDQQKSAPQGTFLRGVVMIVLRAHDGDANRALRGVP